MFDLKIIGFCGLPGRSGSFWDKSEFNARFGCMARKSIHHSGLTETGDNNEEVIVLIRWVPDPVDFCRASSVFLCRRAARCRTAQGARARAGSSG
jgi:hypothetical protein